MKIRGKIIIKKKHKTSISKELHKHDKCWGKKQNKTLHFVTQAQICQNCDTHIHHHHTNHGACRNKHKQYPQPWQLCHANSHSAQQRVISIYIETTKASLSPRRCVYARCARPRASRSWLAPSALVAVVSKKKKVRRLWQRLKIYMQSCHMNKTHTIDG